MRFEHDERTILCRSSSQLPRLPQQKEHLPNCISRSIAIPGKVKPRMICGLSSCIHPPNWFGREHFTHTPALSQEAIKDRDASERCA